MFLDFFSFHAALCVSNPALVHDLGVKDELELERGSKQIVLFVKEKCTVLCLGQSVCSVTQFFAL